MTFEPLKAFRLDVDETAYHQDPCETPSLSSSVAKVLIGKSPMHAHHVHPRLGNGPREDKKEWDLGNIAHKLVLGKGREIAVIDADDYRKADARAARDQARAEGKIPALREQYDNATVAAGVIAARLGDMGIVLSGESEVPIAWQERSNHGPIWCRGLIDHIVVEGDRAIVYDFKTSRSAHPAACARAVLQYRYDVQQAAYTSGVSRVWPKVAGRVEFVFLFAEMVAPFGVTPGRIDDVLREHGEAGWTKAIVDFGESLSSNQWPGYTNSIVTLEAPGWMINEPEIGFEEVA